jgi:hypothetical protein
MKPKTTRIRYPIFQIRLNTVENEASNAFENVLSRDGGVERVVDG